MKKIVLLLVLGSSIVTSFACAPINPFPLSSEEQASIDKIYEQAREQEQMKRDIIISGKPSFVYLNNESDIFFFRDMRLDDKYYKIKIFERLGGLGDCVPGKFYALLVTKNVSTSFELVLIIFSVILFLITVFIFRNKLIFFRKKD